MVQQKRIYRKVAGRKPAFEEFGFVDSGTMYWWASWYGNILGYHSLNTFMAAVGKAMQACATLDLNVQENFIEAQRNDNNQRFRDFKLTRFACYLLAMTADGFKPRVTRARVYFDNLAKQHMLKLSGSEDIQRLLLRDEIKEGHNLLKSVAWAAGVRDFSFFMNEGYLGMYQMNAREVRKHKGVAEGDSLFDYLSRPELAANLYRIKTTSETLSQGSVQSAFEAAAIHKHVGEDIRKMVKYRTMQYPEEIAVEKKLSEVARELQKAKRIFNRAIAQKSPTDPSQQVPSN
jgi:DNA-damage-inducible protein D